MKIILKLLVTAGLATLIIINVSSCKKDENPVKFPKGTFPDSLINLAGINSAYDDYNTDIHVLSANNPIIFSSNRTSSGGQFDLVHGTFSYFFDQETGEFLLETEMSEDPFIGSLVSKINTPENDFGPYRLYSPIDGYEYLIASSPNQSGNLDFYFTRNLPYFGSKIPEILGPYPVNILNSASNETYLCFDTNQDSVYYSSDADGEFDIYLIKKPAETPIDVWFGQSYSSSLKADVINSDSNDRFPFIFRKILVFSSDRPGGMGGYDIYYSLYNKGKWETPVNFGAPVNSASNEYRPVIGDDEEFTNMFLIFSSDRPGGKGMLDLYFTGIKLYK